MAFWKDTWYFLNSIEHEYKYAGNYGAKGEKRAEKRKPTPEQIKKQNQHNREKKMRRLIKANFLPYDMWTCLKYPKDTRKSTEEYKDDLKKFFASMRYYYNKAGSKLKFIYRIEIGKSGGIHIHILVNRLRGSTDTDMLIQKIWKHGTVNFQSIHEYGGYEKLAEYIVKEPDEEEAEQLSLFPECDRKHYIKYSTSRNLIRPVPERKKYGHWTMRKILSEGPKPAQGYYIDKNSIISGVNRYTGMSYLQYTEIRINQINTKEIQLAEDTT